MRNAEEKVLRPRRFRMVGKCHRPRSVNAVSASVLASALALSRSGWVGLPRKVSGFPMGLKPVVVRCSVSFLVASPLQL